MVVTMIIVWAVVVAAALLIEFMLYSLHSVWFAVGGIAALISAPCGLWWPWQILLFAVVSFLFLLALRPFASKFLHTKTTRTNADEHVGQKYKLLHAVKDRRSEIKIADVIWTVEGDIEGLKEGAEVEITGISGNKYLARKSSTIQHANSEQIFQGGSGDFEGEYRDIQPKNRQKHTKKMPEVACSAKHDELGGVSAKGGQTK